MPIAWIICEKLSLLRRIRKAKVNKWANYFLKSHLNLSTYPHTYNFAICFYLFHHLSATNPEFSIYQFFSFHFMTGCKLGFLLEKYNNFYLNLPHRKIVQKIDRFRIQDWLLTCDEMKVFSRNSNSEYLCINISPIKTNNVCSFAGVFFVKKHVVNSSFIVKS